TGHTFNQTSSTPFGPSFRYRVIAVGPTGTSAAGEEHCCAIFIDVSAAFSFAEDLSLTSPLQFTSSPLGLGVVVSPGHNSLNAAPSTGWARFDFKSPTSGTWKAHA